MEEAAAAAGPLPGSRLREPSKRNYLPLTPTLNSLIKSTQGLPWKAKEHFQNNYCWDDLSPQTLRTALPSLLVHPSLEEKQHPTGCGRSVLTALHLLGRVLVTDLACGPSGTGTPGS